MLTLCLGLYVDILFCVKCLAKLSIFIHDDNLVLVSKFVVVIILWLFYLSVDHAEHHGHIPDLHTYYSTWNGITIVKEFMITMIPHARTQYQRLVLSSLV